MKIVIAGGGVAAVEAAAAARLRDPDCGIEIFAGEPELPYRRPALSRMIAETVAPAAFLQRPEAFYRENRIALHTGCSVCAVDRPNRGVLLADGTRASYDRLLLAVGAEGIRPDLPGSRLPGCVALREKQDLDLLRRLIAAGGRTAVVAGGGLLGLECADALVRAGCRVTVSEVCCTLLPRQLDGYAANFIASKLAQVPGLELALGGCLECVLGEKSVTGVRLADGREIPCSTVVFSMGTRPRTSLARAAGLEVARGIVVDDSMQSSDPDIFAAGDCAEVAGRVTGMYAPAREQGRVAGDRLAGGASLRYRHTEPVARLNAFGVRMASIGTVGRDGEGEADMHGNLRRLFYRGDTLAGAILVGELAEADALARQIAGGAKKPV